KCHSPLGRRRCLGVGRVVACAQYVSASACSFCWLVGLARHNDGSVECTPHPVGLFICPAQRAKFYGFGGSYACNGQRIGTPIVEDESHGLGGVGLPGKDGIYPRPARESDVQAPSQMMAMGDAYSGGVSGKAGLPPFDVYESFGNLIREGGQGASTVFP